MHTAINSGVPLQTTEISMSVLMLPSMCEIVILVKNSAVTRGKVL